MPEDRNALLGVLAVRKGWVQSAEVVAAQVALAVSPQGTLAAELVASGALTPERAAELEKLADAALQKAGGDADQAIADNGGLGSLSAPPVGSPDDVPTGSNKAVSFGDDDDEPTSIKLDLTPLPPEQPRGFDDEDEPTKVLDWDRAMKKSLDRK